MRLLEEDAVPCDDDSVEGKAGLGAVLIDELADRVIVRALRAYRWEAV
jgi:hypothetical protein